MHTWLIRRTALEPDKDMNLNFLTVTASLSSLGMHANTHRHKSEINMVVGAGERRYVRELFNDVRTQRAASAVIAINYLCLDKRLRTAVAQSLS